MERTLMKNKTSIKRRIIKWGMIGLVAILILAASTISIETGKEMLKGAMTLNNEETKQVSKLFLDKCGYDLKSLDKYYSEDLMIPSPNGYKIAAKYISKNKENLNKANTVVLVHPHKGDKSTMYPLAEMYLKNGFNVLAYDQRSAGDTVVDYCTFGYYEKDDLGACVSYIKDKMEGNYLIGAHGLSMGGVTVGMYLGTSSANKLLNFAIMDSPFPNMNFAIDATLKNKNLPVPLEYAKLCGTLYTKFKMDFSYSDVDIVKAMNNNKVPTLLINTNNDELCNNTIATEIFNSIKHNDKFKWSIEDSKHANMFWDYTKEYEANVIKLINSVK